MVECGLDCKGGWDGHACGHVQILRFDDTTFDEVVASAGGWDVSVVLDLSARKIVIGWACCVKTYFERSHEDSIINRRCTILPAYRVVSIRRDNAATEIVPLSDLWTRLCAVFSASEEKG